MDKQTMTHLMNSYDFIAISAIMPEMLLAGSAIILLLGGVLANNASTNRSILHLSLFTLLAVLGILILAPAVNTKQFLFHNMYVADNFSQWIKILLVIGTTLTLVISDAWLVKTGNYKFEYVVLVFFSLLGMMLMVSANDLLSVYVALELTSLPLYVLASFNRDTLKSTESGIKYFVLGSLASCMLLFGISLVYGFAGTTSFTDLHEPLLHHADVSKGVLVGIILIICALCFKISAAPFHMWTPDVYEGAPTPVTAYFSVVPKIAAIALFSRLLLDPFGGMIYDWRQVLAFVATLSMIVGALGALTQTNIKRLLAYSSIGHVGYMLVGLTSGTIAGIAGVVIYFTLYIPASIGAFACILMMQREGHYLENINDLSGFSRVRPKIAFCLAVFMFSMAGIPPLAGFFGKMYVFLAAIHSGLLVLAVVGVLTSVIACFYYLKIVKIMYFDEPSEALIMAKPSFPLLLTVYLCALFTLVYFIMPTPLVLSAFNAARALF